MLVEADAANYKQLAEQSGRTRAAKVHAAVCRHASIINLQGKGGTARIRASVGAVNRSTDASSVAAGEAGDPGASFDSPGLYTPRTRRKPGILSGR